MSQRKIDQIPAGQDKEGMDFELPAHAASASMDDVALAFSKEERGINLTSHEYRNSRQKSKSQFNY